MNAVAKEAIPTCFDIRGKDTETYLVGPITSQIIDADRLVRVEWQNGFPNWMLYRTALAGDALYLPKLRHWAISFTWVYAMEGAVRRKSITDELIGCVALDALSRVVFGRFLGDYSVIADNIGVSKDTYRRFRNRVYSRMAGSLDEYWIRLTLAVREVAKYERSEHKRIRR